MIASAIATHMIVPRRLISFIMKNPMIAIKAKKQTMQAVIITGATSLFSMSLHYSVPIGLKRA
jgi:hypothetical protein